MADGIRLHHPTERNCTYIIKHPRKDYHLHLDKDGDVIVSTTVYDRLQEVFLGGLMFLNTVASPPRIILEMKNGKRVEPRIVRHDPNKDKDKKDKHG